MNIKLNCPLENIYGVAWQLPTAVSRYNLRSMEIGIIVCIGKYVGRKNTSVSRIALG